MKNLTVKYETEMYTPAYQTAGASGMDLQACLEKDVLLAPGKRAKIPTGLRLEIPAGFEGQVRPRSGLAARSGVTVLNAPGTVDSDYRGEICVLLVNFGEKEYVIRPGDRIAQLVFCKTERADLQQARLEPTARGEGGFGHTGK